MNLQKISVRMELLRISLPIFYEIQNESENKQTNNNNPNLP